jgi:hypothetical protein
MGLSDAYRFNETGANVLNRRFEDVREVTNFLDIPNLNILRKMALLRAAPLPKTHITRMSGPKRRFAASLCADSMFTILFER